MTRRRRSFKSKSVSGSGLIIASLFFLAVMEMGTGGRFLTSVLRIDQPRLVFVTMLGMIWIAVLSVLLAIRTRRKRHVEDARVAHDERLRRSSLSLLNLTYAEFEHEVAWVVGTQVGGCTTRVIGGSGDKGVDVEMYDKAGHLRGIIQVKHRTDPTTTIPPGVIREMDSVKVRTGAELTYIVTNARFSDDSYELADKYGIVLLDGVKFERHRRHAYASFKAAHVSKAIPVSDKPPAPIHPQRTPSTVVATVPPRVTNQIDPVEQQLEERRKRLGVS